MDSVIRDAIILGINNKNTQECLLRENNSSFGNTTEPMEINTLYHERTNNKIKCKFCGKVHKFGQVSCPVQGRFTIT